MPVNIRQLVNECIFEVLKENLMEGFDPQSAAGPNPASCEQTQHDPYKAWNAKMRKMEEDVNYGDSKTTSKSQLHHQLMDIDTELTLIYSYVKHGKSRTGSFTDDQNNIAVLKAKKQEILQLLKRPTTESKMEEAASKSRYQYKASRESVEKTKRELTQILTQYQNKIQVDLVSTKPVTYGVRFDLFILGYAPGYTGTSDGINQEEWNTLAEIVSKKVNELLPGATLYTDPWTASRKFHIRFETYIQIFDPQLKESDPHGREAQQAGAGQFDPRTFGVNEADIPSNIIYKETRNGKDIYWVDDKETGETTALSPLAIAGFVKRGYEIVEIDADPRSAIRQPDPDMGNYMGDGDRT